MLVYGTARNVQQARSIWTTCNSLQQMNKQYSVLGALVLRLVVCEAVSASKLKLLNPVIILRCGKRLIGGFPFILAAPTAWPGEVVMRVSNLSFGHDEFSFFMDQFLVAILTTCYSVFHILRWLFCFQVRTFQCLVLCLHKPSLMELQKICLCMLRAQRASPHFS